MAGPVSPTMQMSVVLEAQQWNAIMGALSDAPYRIAAPLIQAISVQLDQQASQGEANKPNGADTRQHAI